jgi:hypothetical protein
MSNPRKYIFSLAVLLLMAAAFGQRQSQVRSDLSGVYASSGMTVRAAQGMPRTYVALCELLQRDFAPALHQEVIEQDHHRTARVVIRDDLALSITMEGGKYGTCHCTWTKPDGLKVTVDGATYTKREKSGSLKMERGRVVAYRFSLDEERRLIVSVEVASSARDKAPKVGVYAFPRISDVR